MTGAAPAARWRGASARRSAGRPGAWAWIAAAVAALVYANALGGGFAYDDLEVIVGNEAVHTWSGLIGALDEPYWPGHYGEVVGVWRPLTTALFGVQWNLFGGDPMPFHVTGVLLHAAATAAVVLLLARLLPLAGAAAGGVLFAVHPVHVEAVANAVGNADVMAALFVLLALLVHAGGGERYGWGRAAAVAALFAAGLLTKEGAVVLPALIFLVDAARRDPRLAELPAYLRRRAPTYVLLGALVVALFAARTAILGGVAPAQVPPGAALLDEVPRVWTVASLWPHYVRLLVWPADLAADYAGIVEVVVRWTPLAILGVATALFFLGIALWAWRTGGPLGAPAAGAGSTDTGPADSADSDRAPGGTGPADARPADSGATDAPSRRALGFAVVWFGVTILPVSNVVFVAPAILAERNLYLPSVAVAVGLGWLVAAGLRARPLPALAVAAVVLLLGAARTWQRTPVWADPWGPFDALLEEHPQAAKGWFFRGDRLAAEGRFAEARRAWSIALGRMASDYDTSTLVAARLSGMAPAHQRAAEFLLLRAWREEPAHYTAPGQLAALYLNQGRHNEGERFARAAVERAPENADMRRVLAAHLSGLDRPAEAIPHRLEALRLEDDPPWTRWVWLARDQASAGDTARALASLDTARVRAPGPGKAQVDSIRAGWTAGGAAPHRPGS